MESCSNFIRVRVDLDEINLPFIKQAWVSVDRTALRTVRDFKLTLYQKFKLPEDRNICLYLQKCLLLDDETVFILRDEDFIRVVYENMPSILDTHCSNFVQFTSNSVRSPTIHLTNGSSNTSVPAAKKFRTLSPALSSPSLPGIYERQTSTSGSRCLGESRSIAAEINPCAHLDETELVKEKRKKHKKHLKVEKGNNSRENLPLLEERGKDRGSEMRENNVHHKEEEVSLFFSELDVPKKDGAVGVQNGANSKKRKMKGRKNSSENVAENIEKRVNGTSGAFEDDRDCTGAGTNKLGRLVLCEEYTENDGDKINSVCETTTSKKFTVNEKKLSSEIITQLEEVVCGTSDALGNNVDVHKQGAKKNDAANLRDLDIIQNNKWAQISSHVECKVTDVDHSSSHEVCENVLCPSLKNSPIQVEGDCTQSLGNNCPKKKRRRRRKRSTPNSAEPSGSTINNNFGGILSTSSLTCEKSVSDFTHFLKNEHYNRKHIKFMSSPESSSPVVEAMDSKHSGDDTEKKISTNIDTCESLQGSFETELSPAYEADVAGKCTQDSTCAQERIFSAQGDGTNNQNNRITTDCNSKVDGTKSYLGYPPLNNFPSVGDVIAYKVLELSDSYCPEVSNYKEGRIVNIDTTTDILEVDLVEEQVIVRTGKFENLYPEESPKAQVINKVFVHWSALIEPKLISSGTL